MSDGLFFTFVIGFFFLVWVATGGPSRPISFSGAFITPITNVDSTQSGYGPQVKLGSTISAGGVSASVSDRSGTAATNLNAASDSSGTSGASNSSANSNDSVYKNMVVITRTTAYSPADPSQLYVHLLVSSEDASPVRINNWRFVSASDNATVIISNNDAALQPYTSTTVVTTFPSSTAHDTIYLEDSSSKLVYSLTY